MIDSERERELCLTVFPSLITIEFQYITYFMLCVNNGGNLVLLKIIGGFATNSPKNKLANQ